MLFTELDSPFYPGIPISSDHFVGRKEELKEFTRSVSRIVNGCHIEGVLITGERGVGKSSFSKYVRRYFASLNNMKKPLADIFVDLRSCHDFDSFISTVHFALFEKMKEQKNVWKKLGRQLYGGMTKIDRVSVLDVGVSFTREEKEKLFSKVSLFEKSLELYTKHLIQQEKGGLLLILDNVNNMAKDIRFSNYLKGVTDNLKEIQIPMLFVINAIPETWDIIHKSQPSVSQSYARIELHELEHETVKDYFRKTFERSDVELSLNNLEILTYASGGLPLSMQFIGDYVYWECEGGRLKVSDKVIEQGVIKGVREIGNRYLNGQIFSAICSERYKGIINNDAFIQSSVIKTKDIREIVDQVKFKKEEGKLRHLNLDEAKNLAESFLAKMCNLGVLVKLGDEPTWRFKNRFIQIYLMITKLIPASERMRMRVDTPSKSVKEFSPNLENRF